MSYLGKFRIWNNYKANGLLKADAAELAFSLHRLKNLDIKYAKQLIEQGYEWAVAENITSFDKKSRQKIASLLVSSGFEGSLAITSVISTLSEIDHFKLARELIDKDQAPMVMSLIQEFNLSFNEKNAVLNMLTAKGLGLCIDGIKSFYESSIMRTIDLGKRGSGTPMNVHLYTSANLDSSEPNKPYLQRSTDTIVDFGCTTFSGSTPEEAFDAVRQNMANRPEQWRGASSRQVASWTADVNQALDLARTELSVLAL